jgi:hypothetical protein
MRLRSRAVLAAVAVTGRSAGVVAVVPHKSPVAGKNAFQHPAVYIPTQYVSLGPETAFYDARNARVSSMSRKTALACGIWTAPCNSCRRSIAKYCC